jgi:hypothetical protein
MGVNWGFAILGLSVEVASQYCEGEILQMQFNAKSFVGVN